MSEAAAQETTAISRAGATLLAVASLTLISTVISLALGEGRRGSDLDGSGGGSWTKQFTCRYFVHEVSKEGDNCPYSHELSDSTYGVVCKYFQRGSVLWRPLQIRTNKPLLK